jgi:hypothetical protein
MNPLGLAHRMQKGTPVLLLLAAALAGCVGDDEPLEAAGTYTPVAAEGGEHAMHGGMEGVFARSVELRHFNASRDEAFEHHEGPVGLKVIWQLTTGTARVVLLDANRQVLASITAEGNGEHKGTHEGQHGSMLLNVTGMDATGKLELMAGAPAALGLAQSEPLTYSDTLALDSNGMEWTWDSTGTATLEYAFTALAGTATLAILDGAAEPVQEIVMSGPGTGGEAVDFEGVPGTWTVQLSTDLYTGPIDFTLSGAADEPEE